VPSAFILAADGNQIVRIMADITSSDLTQIVNSEQIHMKTNKELTKLWG